MKRSIVSIFLLAFVSCIFACDNSSPIEELINYGTNPGGGDRIDRPFYVEAYPGKTLNDLTIWLYANDAGTFTIKATVRAATFDGTVIATDSQEFDIGTSLSPFTFNFSNASIEKGSIVTFDFEITVGPETTVFHATSSDETESLTADELLIIGTHGKNPPLDSLRRDGMPVIITGRS